MNDYLKNLTEAVTSMFGDCSHASTVKVREEMNSEIVWDGEVEIFDLTANKQSKRAFAWGYNDDKCEMQYIAVLGSPPILTPNQAVQAAIASGIQD